MAEQSQKKSGKTMKIVWISLGSLLVASLVFAGVAFAHGSKGYYFKKGAKGYSFFSPKDMIEKFDADKDGSVTKEEFVDGMLELHKKRVGLMFSRLDSDENGVLSSEEIKQIDRKKRKGRKGRKGKKDRRYHDDDHDDDDDDDDDDDSRDKS